MVDKIYLNWLDKNLIQVMSGFLTKIEINFYSCNSNNIKELNEMIDNYNCRLIDSFKLFSEIDRFEKNLNNDEKNFFDKHISTIKKNIRLHRRCLIIGEGGIGKTTLVKQVKRILKKQRVNIIDCLNGMRNNNNESTTLIIDDFNLSNQQLTDSIKSEISNFKGRIILTSSEDIGEKLDNMFEKYYLEGVENIDYFYKFSRDIDIDVQKFEYLLFSNNPKQLKDVSEKLVKLKNDSKRINKTNSIVLVTTIFENSIIADCKFVCWEIIKEIFGNLYDDDILYITEEKLIKIIEDFLLKKSMNEEIVNKILLKIKAAEIFEFDNKQKFYKLRNGIFQYALLLRMAFKNKENDIAKNINLKKNIYSFVPKEYFYLFLLDKFNNKLEDFFNNNYYPIDKESILRVILMFKCKDESIEVFHNELSKILNPKELEFLFFKCGGFIDTVFNCSFYFKKYFMQKNYHTELNSFLSNEKYYEYTEEKLKFLCYSVLKTKKESKLEEKLWFGLLCCASPVENIRCLSERLVYEICNNNKCFLRLLITEYNNFEDLFIKESIIKILSTSEERNIESFFKSIKSSNCLLTGQSLSDINFYLKKRSRISNKNNTIMCNSDSMKISDKMSTLLNHMMLLETNHQIFKNWYGNNSFFTHDVFVIKKCNNLSETSVQQYIVDIQKIRLCLEYYLRSYCDYYGDKFDTLSIHFSLFYNSKLMKYFIIARNIVLGKLMQNYYYYQYSRSSYFSFGKKRKEMFLSTISFGGKLISDLKDETSKFISDFTTEYNRTNDFNDIFVNNQIKAITKPFLKDESKWRLIGGEIKYKYPNSDNILVNIVIKIDLYNKICTTASGINYDSYKDSMDNYRNFYIKLRPFLVKVDDFSEKNFGERKLILPPNKMLTILDLNFDCEEICFKNNKGEIVIVCDNELLSDDSFLRGAIYMREDYLEQFIELFYRKIRINYGYEKRLVDSNFSPFNLSGFEIKK